MIEAPQRGTYDVVVVGAGVIGLACAWRAAERGLRVLVADRERPGAGASGVAAGMLAPVTEADFGEEALLRLNLAGAERWPGFADELAARGGGPIGLNRSGALVVAADRDDGDELRRLAGFQRRLGLDVEWLTGRECRRLEPGLAPRVSGGIRAPQDAHVDPGAVVAALAHALGRADGELVAGAPVEAVEQRSGRVCGVRVGGRTVRTGRAVIAAGAWSGRLGIPGTPPVRPVKGQILTLRAPAAAPPLTARLVRTPRGYVVARDDGRVVVGATMEERGFDRRVTAEGVFRLLEAAREVLPDIDELELVEARAGLRPGSPDNAPFVGPGELEGLVWATGHHRNGVLLAPLTADAVVAALTGARPPAAFEPFSPDRPRGGPARAPAGGESAGTAATSALAPAPAKGTLAGTAGR